MRPKLRSVVLALALVSGCRFGVGGVNEDAVAGPCPGAYCTCADTSTCAPTCGVDGLLDGCHLLCERLDRCDAECTDDCELECSHARSCATSCGDGCDLSCEAVGSCDFTCGHDCQVRCTDVSDCRVEMLDGEARCERAGGCEVTCVGEGGVRRPAEIGADGRATCLAQSVLLPGG